jgi:hypothetical protein
MLWTDGSIYEGEWVKGIQHGMGRIVFPDGTFKEGYFENNVYKFPSHPGGNDVMRTTKASTGFASDLVNNRKALSSNPYQLN